MLDEVLRRGEETNVKLARACYKRILPQTADNKSHCGNLRNKAKTVTINATVCKLLERDASRHGNPTSHDESLPRDVGLQSGLPEADTDIGPRVFSSRAAPGLA